ncbi:MAG: fimbrial assembly protein [Betaproteobacteria bacterium]
MAQQINLYNPIFLQKRKHFSAVTMLQALGLLLGGIVAFYGYALNESRTLARLSDDTRKQLQAQSEQVGRLTREFSPQGRSKLLEEEVARAAARLKQRQELLEVLRTGGLGNTEGFSRYLAALARQPMNGVWLTGLTIGGDEAQLLLSGKVLYSDLVPAYIRALNREEVMRGRRVAELRLTAREEKEVPATAAPGANPASPARPAAPLRYVEFNIAAVRGNAPAATDAKGTN